MSKVSSSLPGTILIAIKFIETKRSGERNLKKLAINLISKNLENVGKLLNAL